jgi:hypothetical protein
MLVFSVSSWIQEAPPFVKGEKACFLLFFPYLFFKILAVLPDGGKQKGKSGVNFKTNRILGLAIASTKTLHYNQARLRCTVFETD